jgi:hypothetical protein
LETFVGQKEDMDYSHSLLFENEKMAVSADADWFSEALDLICEFKYFSKDSVGVVTIDLLLREINCDEICIHFPIYFATERRMKTFVFGAWAFILVGVKEVFAVLVHSTQINFPFV